MNQTEKKHFSFYKMSETLISTAVSILIHHRSNTRWSYLKSLLIPTKLTPKQFSQITLQIKNNPHLALSFFTFSDKNNLCKHNLTSYSTIIHVLARSRNKTQTRFMIQTAIRGFSNPLKLFEAMVRSYRECGSAPFVFDLLIESCLISKRIDESLSVFRMLRSKGISPGIRTCNALVLSVSRAQGVEQGYYVYREIFGFDCDDEVKKSRIRIAPNVQTFNTLMGCFYQEEMFDKVKDIFREMENLECVPNSYSSSILMATYCDEGKMVEAENVWEEMRAKAIDPDVVAYNTIIGGFCRIGEIQKAEDYFKEMGLAKIESGCVTYEHLINGYCRINDIESAMLLYKDMRRKDFTAGALTTEKLIEGLCCQHRVDEALECLKIANRNIGFPPSGKSYEILINSLCNEGNMESALKLQADMIGKGFTPNTEVYEAFIDGYVRQGNTEIADRLRNEMLKLEIHGQ